MADLDYMSVGQAQKEATYNNSIKALETSFLYTIKESKSSGLTLYILGGILLGDGVEIEIADKTLSLVASTTNYVEANSATGEISVNQSGFTSGAIKLYKIVTNAVTRTNTTNKKPNPLRASTYSLPEATESVLGGMKIGAGLEKVDGKVKVKVDGTTTTLNESGQVVAIGGGGGSGGSGLVNFKESKNTDAPNATIPLYSFELVESTSNADVLFGRGGNGSFIFFNTSANKVGRNSVDFTSSRSLATQIVSGNSSFGGGVNITVSKDYCFSWGYGNTVTENYATAFGNSNTVSGSSAFATGERNTSSGSHSFSSGYQNTTSGAYSFSSGYLNKTTSQKSSTFGSYNVNDVNVSFVLGEGGNTHGIMSELTLGGRWDTATANSAKGSSQFRIHKYSGQISSATALSRVLCSSLDNNTTATFKNQLSLTTNQIKFFKGVVMMTQENQYGYAVFEIEGLIRRPGAVGTTQLIYSTITPKFSDENATNNGFSVSLAANTTLGCLTITCSTTTYVNTIYCQARLNVDEMIPAW